MAGLGDEERRRQPSPDARVTLRWRLRHMTELLCEERNAAWLGLAAAAEVDAPRPEATDAATALTHLDEAFARWRAHLAAAPGEAFGEATGPAAGQYAAATRRSFALHIADEFIHHGAEAALLRDLYPPPP